MAYMKFTNVSLEYPLYSIEKFSLRHFFKRKISKNENSKYHNIHNNFIRALDNLSFELFEGDRLCILGHNGSGKSTLLRVVANIYVPTTGSVQVSGEVTTLIEPSLGLDYEATGVENIIIKGMLSGRTHAEVIDRLDWIVNFSELGDYVNLPIRTYSSGMLMRLAYSVSTAFIPEILIMDEWLSVGDPEFRKKATDHLKHYTHNAGILLLATNDQELGRSVGNKFIVLDEGKCVYYGPDFPLAYDFSAA